MKYIKKPGNELQDAVNFKDLLENVTFDNLMNRGRSLHDYVKARYDIVKQEEIENQQRDSTHEI